MRLADAHLNPQEFELVLFGEADSSSGNTGNIQALEAQEHLKTCATCQTMARRYRDAEATLNGLRIGDKTSLPQGKEPQRGAQCPAETTWLQAATGLIEEDEGKAYVAHAAACEHCGQRLKEAMEDMAQDVAPEEEKVLAVLPTASPTWQYEAGQRLAARHPFPNAATSEEPAGSEGESAASKNRKKLPLRSLRFAWAGTAAALLVIALWIGWRATREPDVNQLLAQSYQDQRMIQLRISGAKYAPVQTKRGAAGAHLSPTASLLKAEAEIRQGLEKSPLNQLLLHQKGRAELMEGNYRAAIATLRQAKDLPNANPMIAVDLATAYFQKAEAEDNPADGQTSADLLSGVLQRNGDDEIALFNRAIVYQRLSRSQDAINDWEHYLRVSRDEQWDGEARQYLSELKERPR